MQCVKKQQKCVKKQQKYGLKKRTRRQRKLSKLAERQIVRVVSNKMKSAKDCRQNYSLIIQGITFFEQVNVIGILFLKK